MFMKLENRAGILHSHFLAISILMDLWKLLLSNVNRL